MTEQRFKKILIANRGEIAVRIIRACRELGIETVAIFSEPDRQARHVGMADESWLLEGQPSSVYLNIPQVIETARRSGAGAVHPGYGFLSENFAFAQACQEAGLTFIGPEAQVIRDAGCKQEARLLMQVAGIPVVPGGTDPVDSAAAVLEMGTNYGYPLVIKASAGGGGRGLRVVHHAAEVEQALSEAQQEGDRYFGSSQVYVEKYLEHPRHIEVQILSDKHGNMVHLFERDCSSQRRHQKLVEESPAPNLDQSLRRAIIEAALAAARAVGYTSAGTVEFLVSGSEFYFLEMNTRIQVEHPVSEMVTGVDIVKEQILISAGEPLSVKQDQISVRGHAIECRINAEDPSSRFAPSAGLISCYREPQMPWVRVDSACSPGYRVQPYYDSLLAKLIVWGATRQEAIVRTSLALEEFVITGVATTIPFHQYLLKHPAFQSGCLDTTFVEGELLDLWLASPVVSAASAAGPCVQIQDSQALAVSRSDGPDALSYAVAVDERRFRVTVTEVTGSAETSGQRPDASYKTSLPARATGLQGDRAEIKAIMPGLVKEIFVSPGDIVSKGHKLMILEAMKMESEVCAGRAGRIVSLNVHRGQMVEAAAVLAVIGD